MTAVEAGTEFVEQFGLRERSLGVAAGAAHLVALDALAVYEFNRHLVHTEAPLTSGS